MQGKSISLSERISDEKQDKLELPELFMSIALLSANKQGYQSSSASFTVSINTLFCVFICSPTARSLYSG